MKRKILVVDDDKKLVELIKLYLEKDGYRVFVAYDGMTALDSVRHIGPELIVLDLMLPEIDGLDVCRNVRAITNTPIIMLTARTTEDDTLLGLDLGADDYMHKPFSPRELVARVRTVLRRVADDHRSDTAQRQAGDLLVDFVRHEVKLRGELVQLTPKEFSLLAALIKEPGRAFSRLDLLDRVFGSQYEGLERTIDVHMLNLRKKLETNPVEPLYLQTVRGVGYKFNEQTDVR